MNKIGGSELTTGVIQITDEAGKILLFEKLSNQSYCYGNRY